MPAFKLTLASLAISLALITPALAQSAGPGQYKDAGDGAYPQISSSEDGFKAVTANAAKSAEASGNALSGNVTSGDETSVSSEDDPSEQASSSTDGNPVADEAAVKRLPDTGGPAPLIPAAGLLMIAGGLICWRNCL